MPTPANTNPMNANAAMNGLVYIVALVLVALGVAFVVVPDMALNWSSHRVEALPLVMAGRYIFFGALLVVTYRMTEPRYMGVLLTGFAGLALFDGAVYWQFEPWRHIAVGVMCLIAAVYFFTLSKGTTS